MDAYTYIFLAAAIDKVYQLFAICFSESYFLQK